MNPANQVEYLETLQIARSLVGSRVTTSGTGATATAAASSASASNSPITSFSPLSRFAHSSPNPRVIFVVPSTVALGHTDTDHNTTVKNLFPDSFINSGGSHTATDVFVVNLSIVEATLEFEKTLRSQSLQGPSGILIHTVHASIVLFKFD